MNRAFDQHFIIFGSIHFVNGLHLDSIKNSNDCLVTWDFSNFRRISSFSGFGLDGGSFLDPLN